MVGLWSGKRLIPHVRALFLYYCFMIESHMTFFFLFFLICDLIFLIFNFYFYVDTIIKVNVKDTKLREILV